MSSTFSPLGLASKLGQFAQQHTKAAKHVHANWLCLHLPEPPQLALAVQTDSKKRQGYLHPQRVLMTLVLPYIKPIAIADAKHPVQLAVRLYGWLQVHQPRQLVTHACNHGKQVQGSLMHRPLRMVCTPNWECPTSNCGKEHNPPTCNPLSRPHPSTEDHINTSVHACLALACAAQVTAGL